MQKIIGIGNALVDVLARIQSDDILTQLDLPKGSTQFTDADRQQEINAVLQSIDTIQSAGGSAANTMKAISQLGMEAAYIGSIGHDELGFIFSQALKSQGVNPFLVISDNAPTGVASTFISADGQRTFADYMGAATLLNLHILSPKTLKAFDTLYVEGYLVQNHQLIDGILHWAKQQNITTCLDLSSFNIVEQERDFFNYLLKGSVDIVFANEEESFALTHLIPQAAVKKLAEICQIAIVKLGSKGALACNGKEIFYSNGLSVSNVVDTTGAGDSFAAGFLYALAQEKNLNMCLATGNIVASKMIQYVGATLTPDTWTQIRKEIIKLFSA